jgi:hypothetical protein
MTTRGSVESARVMEDDALYVTLSEWNSNSATVFTKFSSCDEAIGPASGDGSNGSRSRQGWEPAE